MALNFLQALLSPGPGLDGSDINAPGTGMPGVGLAPPPQPGITALPDVPNMLQNLNVQPGVTANVAPVPDQPVAPRARRSILDTVGRLADVFAKVGGADALYQPTLDAREDRTLMLGDHARAVDLDKLKLATAQNTLDDAGRARLAQAVRGTQALLAANPQADIAKVFPLLAARAGVDPTQAATLAGQLATDPTLLEGLAGFDDSGDKYGGSVVYAKGPDGKIVAFQPNLKGGKGRRVLPDGFEAVDPLKLVNLGDKQVAIGGRSGDVVSSFNNGINPDKAADRTSREGIAAGRDRTAITVAGMPARAKPAATKPDATAGMRQQAGELLDELDGIYRRLDKDKALVNPKNSVVSNIIARARNSGAGQFVEGTVGTAAQSDRDRINSIRPSLMQSLAKATGMTGKQLDSNADVKLFMQTVTDPTKSAQANREAIAGLRRFLAQNASSAPATSSGGSRALPPRIGAPAKSAPKRVPVGKPTVSNW